jgi:hypothetical protein
MRVVGTTTSCDAAISKRDGVLYRPLKKRIKKRVFLLTFPIYQRNNAATSCVGPCTDGRDKRLRRGKASEDVFRDGGSARRL